MRIIETRNSNTGLATAEVVAVRRFFSGATVELSFRLFTSRKPAIVVEMSVADVLELTRELQSLVFSITKSADED